MKPNRIPYFIPNLTRFSASFTTNGGAHAPAAVGSRLSLRFAGLLSLSAITLFAASSNGQTNRTWTGATDANWNTAANWTGGVPDLTTEVALFNALTANDPASFGTAITIGGFSLTGGEARDLIFTNTIALGQYGVDNTSGLNLSITGTGTTTLSAAQAWTVGGTGSTTFGKAIANGANRLTLEATSTGTGTLTGAISGTGGLTKSGSGTWSLDVNNAYSGTTIVDGGVLRLNTLTALPGGIGSAGGTANLTITGGGVIGLGFNDFERRVGTQNNRVQFTGSGGFAAYGADRNVNFQANLGIVTWNAGSFVPTGSALILGAADADKTVTFQNPIALDGAARTVQANNGTADVDGILSGILSGTGASGLIKTGTGTLALGGTNTYLGVTTLTAGTLSVATIGNGGSAGNLGQASNAATNLVFDGGTLLYTGATASTNRNFTINTNKVATFEVTANNLTITGASTSTNGGLSKTGTGTLTLGGTNTYTGATTLTAGTLSVATIGNGGVAGNLGQATNDATNLVFDGGTLRYTGATASSNRNFTINTNKVATFEVTANNLTITGASTSTNGGLTKAGAGTLTLTGNNLHTGDTIIKAGTLKLDGGGSIASTNIIVGDTGSTGAVLDATTKTGGLIVGNGKTVGGVGTIQGSTTIQGILAPGNSTGILNNLGDIELEITSTFEMEIGGTAAGTGYDQLNVTGSATLAGLLAVNTGLYVPNNGDLFFLIANDGTDAIAGKFSNANVDDATVFTEGGRQWLISYTANFEGTPSFTGGNDVALMAVPEPNAALIGGIGVLLLLRRRRA